MHTPADPAVVDQWCCALTPPRLRDAKAERGADTAGGAREGDPFNDVAEKAEEGLPSNGKKHVRIPVGSAYRSRS